MKREREEKCWFENQIAFAKAVWASCHTKRRRRNPDLSDVFLNEGKIPRDEMKIGIICAACVVSI